MSIYSVVTVYKWLKYKRENKYVVCRTVIWLKANVTFAQYIVFTEEMYKSAVNDDAEDFPKVTVDTYPYTVVIGVKFVFTFVDWGDQSLAPNIGEDARAKDDAK